MLDERLVRVHHFVGDGAIVEDEISTDPDLIEFCRTTFEIAWDVAIDHARYRPA